MTAINLPFGASADRREPTAPELSGGFPCGPADIELFNWLMWWLSGQVASSISKAGFTVDDTDLNRLAESMRSQALNYRVAGGTASALTVTLDPVPSAYTELNVLFVQLASTITGATTINVNGLGAKAIVRADGTALRSGDGIAGQVLMLLRNGDNWQVAGLSTSLLPMSNIQRYTVAGSYTWVVPDGVTRVYVEVQGGGGGGGGAASSGGSGGGGSGGGYAEGWAAVTPLSSITVVVGAGGTAGTGSPSVNGGAGGSSSFGSTSPVSATGGGGGATQAGTAGTGGSGSGGQINIAGGNGYAGTYLNGTSTPVGGNGAPSYRGSAIPAYVSGASVAGFGPGVGGSGSGWNGAATNGGAGAAGQVTIRY